MKNTISAIFLVLVWSTFSCVNADPLTQKLKGDYEAKTPWNTTLRTIVMGENNEAVAAQIIVAGDGCSGAIAGLGTSDGKTIKVKPYLPSSPEAQSCELTIALDKSGKAATISESKCSDYHGAQCNFTGTLRAK